MTNDPIRTALIELTSLEKIPLKGKELTARVAYLEQRLIDVFKLTHLWLNKEPVPEDFRKLLRDRYGVEINNERL